MHRASHILLLPVLFTFFQINVFIAYSQSVTTAPTTIDIGLARFVASQNVHKYYPEFQWLNVDHMVIHDIDGSVAAYVFIFSKSTSPLRSATDLQRHIVDKSTMLIQISEKNSDGESPGDQEEQRASAIEEELYNFNDMATVITGATSDSKLILRHFRGLPEFWVEAQSLDDVFSVKCYSKALQVSRVIMITPMDFRLAASEGTKAAATAPGLRTVEKAALSDTVQCIKVSAKKVENIGAVRKERQAIEDRKKQRFNTLEPAERTRYEQALQDRAKALADEWQQHRESWQKVKNEGG